MVHATNAWNPTGHNLRQVPGCRLYFTHAVTLGGPRTQIFLGTQQHLTFVAELDGHLASEELRDVTLGVAGLYPHVVDLEPGEAGPAAGEHRDQPR